MNILNRVLWTFIGALLTAAGIVGVLLRFDSMPGLHRSRTLITPGMDARWRDWGGWAIGGVIVAGVLFVILGALLLKGQFHRRGGHLMPDLTRSAWVPTSTMDSGNGRGAGEDGRVGTDEGTPAGQGTREAGRTAVATSTLNAALAQDLQGHVRIRRAAVRLTGDRNTPLLRVKLAVTPDADLPELRRHVNRAVGRFSRTSGLRPDIAEVNVKMSGGRRERVR